MLISIADPSQFMAEKTAMISHPNGFKSAARQKIWESYNGVEEPPHES